MTRLFILTGASRGMGAAMAEQLLRRDVALLTISRNANAELTARAAATGTALEQWTSDLAQPVQAAARLEAWLKAQDGEAFESVALINNAAMSTDIGPLEDLEASELSNSLRVGLEAP